MRVMSRAGGETSCWLRRAGGICFVRRSCGQNWPPLTIEGTGRKHITTTVMPVALRLSQYLSLDALCSTA